MAECSESTGTISAPQRRASAMTSSPAHTMVSLLARAMRLPARMAARVGRSPAMPTTAVTTVSAEATVAASRSPASPERTRTEVSESRTFRSAAAVSSTHTASSGRNRRACSSRSAALRWAVRARTGRSRAAATSRVCRPMEPVEPRREMLLFFMGQPPWTAGR